MYSQNLRVTYGVALLLEDFHEYWSLERSVDCTSLSPERLFVKEPQECKMKMRIGKGKRQSQEGYSTVRELGKCLTMLLSKGDETNELW
jgi:hypothetical protein